MLVMPNGHFCNDMLTIFYVYLLKDLFTFKEFNTVMSERSMVDSDDEFDMRIVGNPIHAYKTVKRFAIDLKKIEQDLQQDEWSGNNSNYIRSIRTYEYRLALY